MSNDDVVLTFGLKKKGKPGAVPLDHDSAISILVEDSWNRLCDCRKVELMNGDEVIGIKVKNE